MLAFRRFSAPTSLMSFVECGTGTVINEFLRFSPLISGEKALLRKEENVR